MKQQTLFLHLALSSATLLLWTACGGTPEPSPEPEDTNTPSGVDTQTPTGGDTPTPTAKPEPTPTATAQPTPTAEPTPTGTPLPPPNPWSISAHPCFGNRTDALWFDNKTDGWVGCGSTTEGYGLYATRDGGKTWKKPTTNPAGFFDAYRVNTISRSSDNQLYVGGQVSSGYNVVKLDTSTSTLAVTEVFIKGNQSWNSFQVGGFRRLPDGQALAESLTGNGIAYRASDSAAWEDATKWYEPDTSNHQFLDLVSYDGEFYGCGSTISEPPLVFLPPSGTPKYPYSFTIVPLATGIGEYNGEMWGLTADAEGVAVVGIDQDRDVGKVYTSLADPYTTAGWRSYDLATTFPDDPTWARGVCRGGGRLVVVGEFQKLGEGFVLVSEDNGLTFLDLTPPTSGTDEIPALHKCVAFPDGDFVVAGASGFVGFFHEGP